MRLPHKGEANILSKEVSLYRKTFFSLYRDKSLFIERQKRKGVDKNIIYIKNNKYLTLVIKASQDEYCPIIQLCS